MKVGENIFRTSGSVHFGSYPLTWISDFVLLHLLASTIRAVSFIPQISVSKQHPTHTVHRHYLNALNMALLPAFISWRLVLVCANYPILCQLTTSLQPSIDTGNSIPQNQLR